MDPEQCTITDCNRAAGTRGLCKPHYQSAWKSGTLSNHPLPPRPAGERVCPASHAHASAQTSTCYIAHRCRCTDCRYLHSRRARERSRQHAYGTFDSGLIDAEPIRRHVRALQSAGIGTHQIARLSGLPRQTVQGLFGRRDADRKGHIPQRVSRITAEKILQVSADERSVADGANVSARGTQRRIQALVARGWSMAKLSERLGIQRSNFTPLMQRDFVAASTARKVSALYEQLWDQSPATTTPAERASRTRALALAEARGWQPPLAWDDIDTDPAPPADDDGPHGIDEIAVELAVAGTRTSLTQDERREALTRLHPLGWSDARLATWLGVSAKTILLDRQHLQLAAATTPQALRLAS